MDNGEGYEVQNTSETPLGGSPDSAPFEPIYFMLGFIAGILFINLFKGRWFL